MKKLLFIIVCTIMALALCGSTAAHAAEAAGTEETLTCVLSSGQSAEYTALRADAASFRAALAQTQPGDSLILSVAVQDSGALLIGLDMLAQAEDKQVRVAAKYDSEQAAYLCAIPDIAAYAAQLFPQAQPEQITLQLRLDRLAPQGLTQQQDAAALDRFAAAGLRLADGQPAAYLRIALCCGDETVLLNHTEPFSLSVCTNEQPAATAARLYTLDMNGLVFQPACSQLQRERDGQSYYEQTWLLHGSGIVAMATPAQPMDIKGLSGHWSQPHYRSAYDKGLFLNWPDSAMLAPERAVNTSTMMGLLLNMFAIQDAGAAQQERMEANGGESPDADIYSAISSPEQRRMAVSYMRAFGPSAEQLADMPPEARALDMQAQISRSFPVIALYGYLSPILGDIPTSAEANALLAKFKDGADVPEEFRIAWAFAIQYGWINGDSQNMLRPNDIMLNAELVKLLDMAGATYLARLNSAE